MKIEYETDVTTDRTTDTVQYSTVQYSTVQYSTVQYNTIKTTQQGIT